MSDFICKKCGSTEYEIKDKSNGTGIAHGLYCAKCGFWHKWLGKEELKQYATKESKDEIIAKLQSENADLRERLEKAVELPFRPDDYHIEPVFARIVVSTRTQGCKIAIPIYAYINCEDENSAEARLAELKGGAK